MEYIVNLLKETHTFNGEISAQGEEVGDVWKLVVKDNVVKEVNIMDKASLDDLPWSDDESSLEDGAEYLVENAKGIVSGIWDEERKQFTGYYWDHLSGLGHRWVKIKNAA